MWQVAEILSRQTRYGPNEDAAGSVGDSLRGAAWVVDGATGLGDREYMPSGPTDAAWYATTLSAALADVSLEFAGLPTHGTCRSLLSPQQIFARAVSVVAGQFHAALPVLFEDVPDYARPMAAAAWVRWCEDGSLTFAALGDCRALFHAPDGTVRILGVMDDQPQDIEVNTAVAALHATGITDHDNIWQQALPELRRSRAARNRPGGEWVFSLDPEASAHLVMEELATKGPATLLLVSDGFFRLVDTYQRYDPAGLMLAARERGLEALYEELRAIELNDADCRRIPRLKPEDDASAILISLG